MNSHGQSLWQTQLSDAIAMQAKQGFAFTQNFDLGWLAFLCLSRLPLPHATSQCDLNCLHCRWPKRKGPFQDLGRSHEPQCSNLQSAGPTSLQLSILSASNDNLYIWGKRKSMHSVHWIITRIVLSNLQICNLLQHLHFQLVSNSHGSAWSSTFKGRDCRNCKRARLWVCIVFMRIHFTLSCRQHDGSSHPSCLAST